VVDAVHRRWIRIGGALAALIAVLLVLLVITMNARSDSDAPPPVAATSDSSVPVPTVSVASEPRWPSSVADRKILDQNGDVFLMRSFASWSMAMNLTDDEIATALAGVAGRDFNAVTVWAGGGYDIGEGWNRYTTASHGDWWVGQPWASDLGPGWAAMDRVMDEALRNGLTVNFSFCGGNGESGARPDWDRATDEDMYRIGVAVATRYAKYPNIVWHVMFDDGPPNVSPTTYSRINALFRGIDKTEGASARPVRWSEPNNLSSIYSQLIKPDAVPNFAPSMNGFYDNWSAGDAGPNAVELVEASWNEAGASKLPTGDVETAYDASPYIDVGNPGQQLRERAYSVFLEGGSYMNYSHEDWWPFGAKGWVASTEGLDWQQVPDHVHTVEAQHVWQLIDTYVADRSWKPDDGSFLTDGVGSGDDKAAAGRSDTAALVYVPSARDLVVDTTVIAASDRVRLRWYDPTTGAYTEISASEPPRSDRAVSAPPAHRDGTTDWVLVVDRAGGTATTTQTTQPSG
jgi:hypothetical protein